MRSVRVAALELAAWDDAPDGIETLLLSSFTDERPLKGAAGLADWRLLGRLSSLLRDGRVSTRQHEQTLLPGTRRLPMRRLIWYGLGPSRHYDESRYRADLEAITRVVAAAEATTVALQLPGRQLGLISARRAMELFCEEVCEPGPSAYTVLEDPVGMHDALDVLRMTT